MSFFELTSDESRSFLGRVFRHSLIHGEEKLVRFSDSKRGHEGGHGSYWMYASEINEVVGEIAKNGPYGHCLIRKVSERWAICDDWGDLGRVWVMTIPAGHTLDAYFGYAKYQPKISGAGQQKTGKYTNLSYEGGSMQIVTRIGDREKRWIRGPYRALDFSAGKI